MTLPAPMLQRGFWLYVWRVVVPDGGELLYIGRTGDNSSPNASPAYVRMGQHLGSGKNVNALRSNLLKNGITAEDCLEFDLVAHGPIHAEVARPENHSHSDPVMRLEMMEKHLPIRNEVGAMEKRLSDNLREVGYRVMNTVKWKHPVADDLWLPVREAFTVEFPKLRALA